MSYGQSLVKMYLDICEYKYIENYRPDWLHGLELDFYLSGRNLAIEFNGDQHYGFTEFGNPKPQQFRDFRKKTLCKEMGIRLMVLDASDLEYTKLRGKGLKTPKKFLSIKGKELRNFNSLSKEYRKILINNYNSPSAHRKNSKIRKESLDNMNSKYSL